MRLQQFEQRLERLVEGAFAKAFRGELQPVELGRRLTREMDLHRTVTTRGLVAPNYFEVVLSQQDAERFKGFVEELARELVETAREHAHNERYDFLGPVEVEIGWSEELEKSTFAINVEVHEQEVVTAGFLVLATGERVPIDQDVFTIGRLGDCDLPLADANASRRHAQLRRDGDRVYLIDLGSTNGTLVNAQPVRQHLLRTGDVITIGKTPLRFEAN